LYIKFVLLPPFLCGIVVEQRDFSAKNLHTLQRLRP